MGTVTVDGVSKAYRIYPSKWARLAEWLLPGKTVRHESRWILRDIHFHIGVGESVALAGMNGAGKSTLLKIINGTTAPTTGAARVTGRVASLLELGMGFHPDFTGRQNVYTAGQLMGLTESQLTELMPDIEAFAEIGEYIDQHVRTYSSGMQMRLAFSLATALRPDVLIVDEALSVGDAYFQHKSFDRIRQFKAQGTTLLLVSHDRGAIQAICDRVLLLHQGDLVKDGPPEAVMDYYNALLAQEERIHQREEDGKILTQSGNQQAVIERVQLCDATGQPIEVVAVASAVRLVVQARAVAPLERLVCGYVIRNRLGQEIYGTNTYHFDRELRDLGAGEGAVFEFAFSADLGPGEYSMAVALTGGETHIEENYEWRDLATFFTVVNRDRRPFTGFALIEPEVEVRRIEAREAAAC